MPDGCTSTFHAERLTGIGGSDLGAILGLSPWRTPYQVWLEKTGRSEPQAGSLAMRYGIHNEDFVAKEYEAATGRKTERYTTMLRHPEAPLIAHPDRLVVAEGQKRASYKRQIRTDRGLECKAVNAFSLGRDSEWGPAGTDQVPQPYLLQVASYQACTGCEYWDLAALIGNSELRIYTFRRDRELEDYILEEASNWWRRHIEADTPPDPQSELEAKQRWPRHAAGKALHATVEVGLQLRQLAQIRADMRLLEAREKAVKDQLYPALADAEVVISGGEEVASYRANRDSQKVDYQALTVDLLTGMDPAEQARLMAAHTRTVPGARVLRLAKSLES